MMTLPFCPLRCDRGQEVPRGTRVSSPTPPVAQPFTGLSRLEPRFLDQLSAIGALLLEVLAEVLRRVESRDDPDIGEARLAKLGLIADGGDLLVEPRDDRAWGARRSDKSKIDRRKVGKPEFAQGRHIRK